jgi:hypothetical protein
MFNKILAFILSIFKKKHCEICNKPKQLRFVKGKGNICFTCYLKTTTRQERRAFERKAKKYEQRKK